MSKHIQTQTEWEQTMARRVMEQLRGELYLDQRYLTAALGALPPAPQQGGGSFATDGGRLYYPTAWLLDTYRKNRRYLPRAYLHSLFHCIFRHLWLRDKRDPDLWGLACDIAVESTLDALNTPAAKRPVGWVRQQCYAQLRAQCRFLAAGPIYRVLAKTDADTLNKWQREFYTDSHRLWPADPDSPEAQMQGRQWEDLGRQTELSMEENGRRAGQDTTAQALQAQLQAGRSRRTYKDFLRRFAVWHEEPHLDPDEFDLGFYSYGLRTYGKLPLIEPLESREVKKIRDFVIVVDTSESTAGELVKSFLKETFALLTSQDSFFRKCRILVMQADNAVREETWLTLPGSRWWAAAERTSAPRLPALPSCAARGRCATCRACFILPTARASTRPSARRLRLLFCFWRTAPRRPMCPPGPCAWFCSRRNLPPTPTRKDDELWIFNAPKRKSNAPCRRIWQRMTSAAR